MTVALVDRFGTVQALLRGDNAAEHTIEAAKQKPTRQQLSVLPPVNSPNASTVTARPSPTFPAPCSCPAVFR